MYRLLTYAAIFKFFIAIVVVFASTDSVLLVSAIFTALSAIITRAVQEGEVAIVLTALILLVDIIGLLLSLTALMPLAVIAYIFVVTWDIHMLRVFRQLLD
ncbi:MAG: hypothetical protein ACK4M3_02575 [Pyrobaculum sp.]